MALFAIPILQSNEFQNTLLIEMGNYVGGKWMAVVIAIDAFLVLSGAVLTSFVGVTGLLERMTLDRIMPQFFLKKSSSGSSYKIIIMFFLLSVSVLIITNGDVKLLNFIRKSTTTIFNLRFLFQFVAAKNFVQM